MVPSFPRATPRSGYIFFQVMKTRAAIEMHHFFSEVPRIWELEISPKSCFFLAKIKLLRDEKSHGLGIQRE